MGIGIDKSKDWPEALMSLIENDGKREILGSNGRKVAQENFDIVLLSKKLLNVINDAYN